MTKTKKCVSKVNAKTRIIRKTEHYFVTLETLKKHPSANGLVLEKNYSVCPVCSPHGVRFGATACKMVYDIRYRLSTCCAYYSLFKDNLSNLKTHISVMQATLCMVQENSARTVVSFLQSETTSIPFLIVLF